MRTPRIALIAYTDLKGKCFVSVPNEPGRYVRTDLCVAFVACPNNHCGAAVGEPCKGSRSGKYWSTTHADRRSDYQYNKFWLGTTPPDPDRPKDVFSHTMKKGSWQFNLLNREVAK